MVYDESGAPIRRVEGSDDSGFQRVAWDLRYPAGQVQETSEDGEEISPDAADHGAAGAVGDVLGADVRES